MVGHRILITGCSGYLAQGFIRACRDNPALEWIGGIDIHPPRDLAGWQYISMDVRNPDLADLLTEYHVDTLVHLAWIFNPTHHPRLEYEVDVLGSRNVLEAARTAGVDFLLYLSSTTAYGPRPDNPPALPEDYPRRGHKTYLYSSYKAEVDTLFLEFMSQESTPKIFMVRAPIVLGKGTSNIVSEFITRLPFLIQVRGFDPPMQFLHEEDVARLLVWAVNRRPTGVYNLSGHSTVRYSELIRQINKPCLKIPYGCLVMGLKITWSLRLLPFPPGMLDFIRYPWVADCSKFIKDYEFRPLYSSKEALNAYIKSLRPYPPSGPS